MKTNGFSAFWNGSGVKKPELSMPDDDELREFLQSKLPSIETKSDKQQFISNLKKDYQKEIARAAVRNNNFVMTDDEARKAIEEYNQSIRQSNSSLEVMGAKSKLASIGVNLLQSAGIAAAGSLAMMAGQAIVNKIRDVTVSMEEAETAANSMMGSFQSARDAALSNTRSVAGLKDEYAALSQGVNTLTNANISLPTADYERYLEINNQIAGIYPELVHGYDAQGNAILNLKNNMDSLTEAAKNAQKEAYALAFNGSEDIENSGFEAVVQDYRNKNGHTNQESGGFFTRVGSRFKSGWNDLTGQAVIGSNITSDEAKETLTNFIENTGNNPVTTLISLNNGLADLIGVKRRDILNASDAELEMYREKARSALKAIDADSQHSLSNLRTAAEGYLKGVSQEYNHLDETQQNLASALVSGMSQEKADFITEPGKNSELELTNYVDGIVERIQTDGSKATEAYREMSNMLSAPGEITSQDLGQLKGYLSEISLLSGESETNLSKAFGIDYLFENENNFSESIDHLSKGLVGYEQLRTFTDGFNDSQKQAWLTATKESTNALDAIAAYQNYMVKVSAGTTDGVYNIIDALSEEESAFQKVQEAQSGEAYDYGDTYDAMNGMIERAKELAESKDVGTNEFKAIAAMFSPTGADDYENWQENLDQIERYFTEDSNEGMDNFLNDLQKKDLASKDADGNWELSIDDLESAAKELNIGFEPFLALLDMLSAKGIDADFVTTPTEAMDHLTDLTQQLYEAESELYDLEQNDPDNSTAIEAKKEQIEQLKGDIENTSDSLEQLLNEPPGSRENDVQKTKQSLEAVIEQYNAQSGSLPEEYRRQWAEEIISAGKDSGYSISLDSELKLNMKSAYGALEGLVHEIPEEKDIILALPNANNVEERLKVFVSPEIKKLYLQEQKLSSASGNPAQNSSSDNSASKSDGTFHAKANGTVHGHNVSLRKNETALVDEVPYRGTHEGLVRNGVLTEWTGGAHFEKLRRGDIIFNARQMYELKKHGYVTSNGGHGRMIGSSFADGTIKNVSAYARGTGKSSSLDSFTKYTSRLFDWFEIRLDVLKSKTDKWVNAAEKAVNFSKKETYYKKAIKSTQAEQNANSAAASKYRNQAKKIGSQAVEKGLVSQKFVNNTIRALDNGTLTKAKISKYSDAQRQVISSIKEWHDKSVSCKQAVQSLTDSLQDLYTELMNIPNEKAAEAIEKINDQLDILESKTKNLTSADAKNANLDQQAAREKSIHSQYASAYARTEKQLSKAKSSLNPLDNAALKSLNKKDKNAIEKAVSQNQTIPTNDKWSAKVKRAVRNYNAAVKGKQIEIGGNWSAKEKKNAEKYNAALKASDTAKLNFEKSNEDYQTVLRETAKEKFDNIQAEYENKLDMLQYNADRLKDRISEIEASGANVSIDYYNAQKNINRQMLEQYQLEKAALEEQLKTIPQGTEEWYDAYRGIQQVSSSISECTQNTYDLNNAINEAQFDLFDRIHAKTERLIDEQELFRDLISHEEKTDEETGTFTDAGKANLVSLSAQYRAAADQNAKTGSVVRKLKEMYDRNLLSNGEYTFNSVDDLQKKLEEMYDTWQSDIKKTYDLESQLSDAMKEKYEAELNMLKELIHDRNDALKAEKDLHDYQKTLAEKTDHISLLQRQIAAVRGDTSQEGMARLQKLQQELSDAREDLKETEYERYLSDQEDMTSRLYDEYEEFLNKKLDDFYVLVKEGLETAGVYQKTGNDYLAAIAAKYQYTAEDIALAVINASNAIPSAVQPAVPSSAAYGNPVPAAPSPAAYSNPVPSVSSPTVYSDIIPDDTKNGYFAEVSATPIRSNLLNALNTKGNLFSSNIGYAKLVQTDIPLRSLPVSRGQSVQYGDIVLDIDLPGVTNPNEFISAIQNSQKLQKAIQNVTVDRIAGGTRLGVRNLP